MVGRGGVDAEAFLIKGQVITGHPLDGEFLADAGGVGGSGGGEALRLAEDGGELVGSGWEVGGVVEPAGLVGDDDFGDATDTGGEGG